MNDVLMRTRDQLRQILSGFTTGQKTVTALTVVGVLIGAYLFTGWASKPSYTPLYTGLDAEDAAAVTEALAADGISHKLANGGGTILVPANKVYETRIALSAEGLPSGGKAGYELLDNQSITSSEFRQRVDYQRALEGELSQTIRAIDGVDDADVHLVIPKEDLFTEDQQKATASVLLTLRGNASLSGTTVQTVVHLVSSSVEGLAAQDVAVSDSAGNVLAAPGEEGASLAAGDFQAKRTAQYERDLTTKLRNMLTSVVGTNGADVVVKAELNFDDTEQVQEEFEDGEAPVVREVTNDETFTGTSANAPAGVLGQNPATAAGDNSNYEKTASEIQRAVGKTTTRSRPAQGRVERQSVSVLLDQQASRRVDLAAMTDQLAAAAGIDEDRGDVIEVSRVAFDTTAQAAEDARLADARAAAQRGDMLNLVKSLATLLLVGIGLLFAYRKLRGTTVEESIPLEHLALEAGDADLLELDEDDIIELEPARRGPMVSVEGDEDPGTVLVSRRQRRELDRLPGIEERLAENADIADLIDRQPDDVAQLLRGWMAERR
jgi:flagellar M-ring protein FliF